jgi:DTW domain-containing protein YfiP
VPSCYCAHVPRLHNHWPVRILQHPQESHHALGTARIASLGLNDCLLGTGKNPERMLPSLQDCVLIYPGKGSQPISRLQSGTVRPLLFLDATWRKSQRMLLESALLAALPRYHLENPIPSRYRIRREPRAEAVSTLEAIVQTLEILEAAPGRYAGLLEVMDMLVDEQVRRMGSEVYQRNYVREGTESPQSRRQSAESESAECSGRSPDHDAPDH